MNILYKIYFICSAKRNTKGYCLSKNKETVDIYKIGQIGGIMNNSYKNINSQEINPINNSNIINTHENQNLFQDSLGDENKIDLDP